MALGVKFYDRKALAGTSGTPGDANRFVTDEDPRLSGSGPHAPTHKDGGSDSIRLDEFADPSASVQFAQQQALQFCVENRTSDPGAPAVGEIWLRTDL